MTIASLMLAGLFMPAWGQQKSFPGFHGVDHFDWDVVGENAASHDTAIVEVR